MEILHLIIPIVHVPRPQVELPTSHLFSLIILISHVIKEAHFIIILC